MRTANRFTDPSGVLAPYDWHINHNEESETGVGIPVERTANTAGTGLVRQQGDPTPLSFTYSGTIMQEVQLNRMLEYVAACHTRTIRFRDFAGDEYEVLITSFRAPRERVASNPRARNEPWLWRFTIEMDVIRSLAGPYAAAGLTP